MVSSELNQICTIHVKSNKSSLRLAQFHKPSSMKLCKSHSHFSWNHSCKIDTLINRDDHTASIVNPDHKQTGLLKSRGLQARFLSLATHSSLCENVRNVEKLLEQECLLHRLDLVGCGMRVKRRETR